AAIKRECYLIIVITIIVRATLFLVYKVLLPLAFDDEHAVTLGIHAERIHFLFIILTALVIVASIRIVGVVLVSALMSLPVEAAMRLAGCFKQLIALSIMFAEIAVIAGLVSGYYLSIPPGGTIVVIAIILLLL